MRAMLLIAAVLLVGCEDRGSGAPSHPAAPAVVDVSELQQMADQACLCARSSEDDGACWKAFDTKMQALEADTPSPLTCGPFSTGLRCIDSGINGFCVTTEHKLLTSRDLSPLCSAREVQIVEAAFREVAGRSGDREKAAREAERVARALIRGEALPQPTARTECGRLQY